MSILDQKRVTVRLKCPNPLFEEWLIGWKQEAAANESKMQYIYNHALQSLRKYPLPLESGRDCKILKGFGDKLCKMLDEKLKQYKKTHRTTNLVNNVLPTVNKNSKKNVSKTTNNTGSSTKQYIPQYGSGGYAILVTLYKQSLEPNYPGYLSKNDIILYGQTLVNSSFTKPDPGSRYTAWSSMRTLLSKNLVFKYSHPPKFALTDEGRSLAEKLFIKSQQNDDESQGSDVNLRLLDTNLNTFEAKSSHTGCLIDKNNTETDFIPDNFKSYDINIIDDLDDVFSNNPEHEVSNRVPKLDSNDDSDVEIVEVNNCLPETSSQNQRSNLSVSRNKEESEFLRPISSTYPMENCSDFNIFSKTMKKRSLSFQDSLSTVKSSSSLVSGGELLQKYNSTNSVKTNADVPCNNNKNVLTRSTSSSSITSTKSMMESFLMAPYSFDIILYVDNNETSGSHNSQNDEILVTLSKREVLHEVKDLKVGDFVWVCRHKETKKELVLPYAVERKRMDDFAHSIKDKRYYEQKFRLKKSGIENLIYLVESHGRNQHVGLPLQTLHQAASNTAIQENFFIKFTENTRETAEYLAIFSKMLRKIFESKTLASCAKEDIQLVDMKDDLVSLMTFKEFNESSVKNKRMRVTDLFVKMLLQIKGMSVERALAVTQIYPTPTLLKMAYLENPTKGEKLLSTIKYGKFGKCIGPVLSKIVYQAFEKTQY